MEGEIEVCMLSNDPNAGFPDPARCRHPDGLLAWGGDLSTQRILAAYAQGIFPWYEQGSPILWWSPDPRMVFVPNQFHISRSLRRTLRKQHWTIRLDTAFEKVMHACAKPRPQQPDTWITPGMVEAYTRLHALGFGHSIEVWDKDELIGGLYGLSLGQVFFAESKFHKKTDASKVALAYLMRCMETWSFALVDCQVKNPHLERLGALPMSRADFRATIARGLSGKIKHPTQAAGLWTEHGAALEHWVW